MFNIGTGEMIMIAVVALLVLGPQRLPELARGIGKFIREFRRQTDDVRNVVEREFYRMDTEINSPQVPPVIAPQLVPPVIVPQLVPPTESVPQAISPGGSYEPTQQNPVATDSPAPVEPQPLPVDESDPGHPDHHREEKPAEEPQPTGDKPTDSIGKVG